MCQFCASSETSYKMSISSYIRDDLSVRLRTSQELPVELTLDSLASFYNVSFTPVRAAVAELIENGLLEKGSNRRLARSSNIELQASTGSDTPALPQRPREPFEIVRDELVRLSLKGGETVYLREETTAEKHGISRSAIRNIFHRLAGSGLLEHIPRRGWRLRPFCQDDLNAYLEIRELLELKALELARPHFESAALEKLLKLNQITPGENHQYQVDESLHSYIIKLSGNSYIRDFFKRQGLYFEVLFRWEDHDRAAVLETLRQHRAVLHALLEKDWLQARKALAYHIRNNHPILSNIVIPEPEQD